MNTESQSHSNVKLSAAQIKMLKWCEHGIQFSVRTEKADSNRATRLASMGLVSYTSTKFGFNDYLITDAGREFLAALTPVVPTIEAEAPAINEVAPEGLRMDADTYPYSEGELASHNTLTVSFDDNGLPEYDDSAADVDYGDDLFFLPTPSKKSMKIEAAPVIESKAPAVSANPFKEGDRVTGPHSDHFGKATVTRILGNWVFITYDDGSETSMGWAYIKPVVDSGHDEGTRPAVPSIGDTVTFRFNTYSPIKEYFSGTIVDLKTSVVLNSVMYCVTPDADDRLAYFAPVWIMPYQIEGQAHLDHAYDQLPALRKIEAAYVAWETAFLAGRYEEAGRLDMIHRKLEDEHHERTYGPRRPSKEIAPQSPQKGATADLQAVQAYSSTMRDPASGIANTPASRALSIRPNETHPLRVIQVGSAANKTDWEALQVVRAAQHEAAKARVKANTRLGGGL